ncbi:hypothetical protein EGW08_015328, partial [Elysia chlorotica]
ANSTDFDLNGSIVKVWAYRGLSCIGLGGLAFTFALMAMLAAILARIQKTRQRSRSRQPRPTRLSFRDSVTLILLCGQPANFALGVVSAWFGAKTIQNFLNTDECAILVQVGVASQWNITLSTPIITFYYALILADLNPVSRAANGNRGGGARAGPARQNGNPGQQTAVGGRAEGTNEQPRWRLRHGKLTALKMPDCYKWWAGDLGVVALVVIVYSLTLTFTYYSLTGVWSETRLNVSIDRVMTPGSFCSRFFAFPEKFPRRETGAVLLLSVAFSAIATLALSRELERKWKRRHAVGAVTPGASDSPQLRHLRSFTRPPDEGAHFHHYAGQARLPAPYEPGDGGFGFVGQYNNQAAAEMAFLPAPQEPGDGGYGYIGLYDHQAAAAERSRLFQLAAAHNVSLPQRSAGGSDSVQGDNTSLVSGSTPGPWSDSEFYDAERTRHIAQSPPPPVNRIRENARDPLQLHSPASLEHGTSYRVSLPRSRNLSPEFTMSNQNQQNNLQSNNCVANSYDQLQTTPPLGLTNNGFQPPTNQNARTDWPEVNPRVVPAQSISSGEASGPIPGTPTNEDMRVERDLNSLWERLQRIRLVSLIFPHRQTGANRKRFNHTKVEHVRGDILPPNMTTSTRRNSITTQTFTMALTMPEIVTFYVVCMSAVLYVMAYSTIAVYLLLTDGGVGVMSPDIRYRFLDNTFEPYLAILLTKASLDSLFCFAAIVSISPMFITR